MADPARAMARRSALNGLQLPAIAGSAVVTAVGTRARWIFRGEPALIAAAFGVAPSTEPCRAASRDGRAALWLGPDEWLLLAPDEDRQDLVIQMHTALAGKAVSLVDVSNRNCGLIIDGPGAARVLNAGCPLDLDIAAFPVGMCTRTLFAKAEIVLWRAAPTTFHFEFGRTFAPYIIGLVTAAMSEMNAEAVGRINPRESWRP